MKGILRNPFFVKLDLMNKIEFIGAFGDVEKTVSLSQASGGGSAYQISINNFHCGTIEKIWGKWVAYFNDRYNPDFMMDDITILGEIQKS